MTHSSALLERYQTVQARIEKARQAAHRQDLVDLLAASKTKPIEDIIALADAGQTAFGENYVQEALAKIAQRPDLEWHFIGPIQSNKTKSIAEHFQWVHSIDRLKIAERLSKQRPAALAPLNVLLEVNISQEESKAGFAPEAVLEAAKVVASLPNLVLRGLMAIPAKAETPAAQHAPFKALREQLQTLQTALPEAPLDTLSMGMSADLEAAVAEGATMVRIGTDLFGARNTAPQS